MLNKKTFKKEHKKYIDKMVSLIDLENRERWYGFIFMITVFPLLSIISALFYYIFDIDFFGISLLFFLIASFIFLIVSLIDLFSFDFILSRKIVNPVLEVFLLYHYEQVKKGKELINEDMFSKQGKIRVKFIKEKFSYDLHNLNENIMNLNDKMKQEKRFIEIENLLKAKNYNKYMEFRNIKNSIIEFSTEYLLVKRNVLRDTMNIIRMEKELEIFLNNKENDIEFDIDSIREDIRARYNQIKEMNLHLKEIESLVYRLNLKRMSIASEQEHKDNQENFLVNKDKVKQMNESLASFALKYQASEKTKKIFG